LTRQGAAIGVWALLTCAVVSTGTAGSQQAGMSKDDQVLVAAMLRTAHDDVRKYYYDPRRQEPGGNRRGRVGRSQARSRDSGQAVSLRVAIVLAAGQQTTDHQLPCVLAVSNEQSCPVCAAPETERSLAERSGGAGAAHALAFALHLQVSTTFSNQDFLHAVFASRLVVPASSRTGHPFAV